MHSKYLDIQRLKPDLSHTCCNDAPVLYLIWISITYPKSLRELEFFYAVRALVILHCPVY